MNSAGRAGRKVRRRTRYGTQVAVLEVLRAPKVVSERAKKARKVAEEREGHAEYEPQLSPRWRGRGTASIYPVAMDKVRPPRRDPGAYIQGIATPQHRPGA